MIGANLIHRVQPVNTVPEYTVKMASDAEFVETVMMSQSILQLVDTVNEGENDTTLRTRALSGEVDSEASKKPRQVYSTDGGSDLLELMKAQFTSF